MPEGLDLVGYQDAITARVTELYGANYDIVEDTNDDSAALTRTLEGKMGSYIILRYGPKLPSRRGKSLAGARHDGYYATVDIMAITSKGRKSRALCDAVTNDLIGWAPDGVSPMSIQDDGGMFAAFVVQSNEARPTRNIASQRMRFNVNTNNIGTDARP